ncbi:MAG: NADPH:quinone oxidoreductase family protein [Pseudomonadota bacterium]
MNATMGKAMMRCFAGDALDGLESFTLRTVPIPEPGPGEVRLRVEATAFGYVDGLIARGGYQLKPALPYTAGAEIVGIVDAVGADVPEDIVIGQQMATWLLARGGGAADHVLVDQDWLVPVPPALDPAAVASLLLDYLTAYYALFDRGALKPGETVLVLAAAGGIGSAAVDLAVQAGAHVIAAASTPEKRSRAIARGAAAAIDYLAEDWRDELKRTQPGAGIDVIFDPVAGATFEPAFRSLGKGGRHLILGFAGGDIPRLPANLPLLKNGSLIGADARYLIESDLPRAKAIWRTLFALLEAGAITPPEISAWPLDAAQEALGQLMDRGKVGKLVLLP